MSFVSPARPFCALRVSEVLLTIAVRRGSERASLGRGIQGLLSPIGFFNGKSIMEKHKTSRPESVPSEMER
jgi:hypothetical protein